MSTIQNAVQEMVNNLTAKMQSGQPFTPEEQMLAAKAISQLETHQTWEQAVVAVVEEHLDTATAALLSAEGKIDAANTTIQAKANALDLIPTLEQNLNIEIAKIVPNTASVVKRGVGAAYGKGVVVVGASDTLYGSNSAMRSPPYSNAVVEANVVPYFDSLTGRMYVAYISRYVASSTYHMNIHFGYWKDQKFTTIYRQNLTSTAYGDFSTSSNDQYKTNNVFGVIVPLRKNDDPDDVRFSLVLCSNYSGVNESYSWASVISAEEDGTGVNIYKAATVTESDFGNAAADHPLAANIRHCAYDRVRKVLVGYKGSLQCWDGAVGIVSSNGTEEDWVNGVHPTFDYPAEEIAKTDVYISFTGYRQNTLPQRGRFIYSLGDTTSSSYRPSVRSANIAGSGYTVNTWYSPSQDQFSAVGNTVDYDLAGQGSAQFSGTYLPYSQNVYSYLTGTESGATEVRQVFYQPNYEHYSVGEETSRIDLRRLKSLSISVVGEDGGIITNGEIDKPERSGGNSSRNYEPLDDYLFQPTCYDESSRELHVYRASHEYLGATATYCSYTLIYKL